MVIHLAELTHQYISWLHVNIPSCRTALVKWGDSLPGPPEHMDQSPSSQLWLWWIML